MARILLSLLSLVLLILLAANPAFIFPPGLDEVEAVGKFLNGKLPNTTPAINSTADNWDVEPAFPRLTFNDPTVFVADPNSNRLYVGSRDGKIYSFDNDYNANRKDLVLDLSSKVAVVWDGGFLGMAFHPDFGQGSRYFYVWYCARRAPGVDYIDYWVDDPIFYNTYLRLSRFTIPEGSGRADPNSELVMINHRLYGGTHRGGGMAFGDDGYLYVTVGEQWRYFTAQDTDSTLEGGVLRLDVDRDGSRSHAPRRKFPLPGGPPEQVSGVGYYIPNDNPWLSPSGADFEEYYSLGHRAPHRLTVDQANGRIWIGEVGHNTKEEINVLEKGGNYGWPYREGTIRGPYGAVPGNLQGNLTEPAIDFTREETVAIIGGYVYRGNRIGALQGRYLCGGHSQNRIWALDYNPTTKKATKEYLCQFTPGALSTFGQDNNGEVYLMGLGNGVRIYRMVAEGAQEVAPQLLSQTGVFKNMQTLELGDGGIPYDLNEPFWSDHAIKSRYIFIPNDGNPNTAAEQISFNENGDWDVPRGTVVVKHFEMNMDETRPNQNKRLETRLIIKGDDDRFYGLTYKWNASGTDAELLPASLNEILNIKTASGTRVQEWHYPSRDECMVCHNSSNKHVLGFKTRHLNKEVYYEETNRTANQLVTLKNINLLSGNVNEQTVENYLTSANKYDENADLELRARSYLDMNCAYCHRPGGGNRAVFDARLTTALEDQNLIEGIAQDNLGIDGAMIIVPGEPEKSVLYQRMNSVHQSYTMPPLAKDKIDTAGVRLIGQWIESLGSNVVIPAGCLLSEIGTDGIKDLDGLSVSEGGLQKAFDNNPMTFALYFNKTGDYYDIVFDLGFPFRVSGFKYLPRQDGSTIGSIRRYSVFVSEDGQDWGNALRTGTFNNSGEVKEVGFGEKTGRFFKLRVNQVYSGGAVSLAELVVNAIQCGKYDQTISFEPVPQLSPQTQPFDPEVLSSSGLAVELSIISGPAVIENGKIKLTGKDGLVRVLAKQAGNEFFNAAEDVERSFLVTSNPILGNCSADQPQHEEWGLVYVDSEETQQENGRATNAFDGNPNTYWHTQWSGQPKGFPHEIQLDLKRSYNIKGFRYVPRQGNEENGRIKQFQFFVSDDQSNWGNPVSGGTFANNGSTKTINFQGTRGRYVRLLALNEVNDGPWVAMAELEIIGDGCEGLGLKESQIISFNSIEDQWADADPIPLTASATSGLPVSYQVVSGPAVIQDGNISFLGASGEVILKAIQQGNDQYYAAEPVIHTFQVFARASVNIQFPENNSELGTGEVILKYNIAGALEQSNATRVEIRINNEDPIFADLDSDEYDLKDLGPGTYTVVLRLLNDRSAVLSTASVTFTIIRGFQRIIFDQIPDKTTLDEAFTIKAEATSGLPVSYNILLGPATIQNDTIFLLGSAGAVEIQAVQLGNESYNPANPVTQIFQVNKAFQNLIFNPIADKQTTSRPFRVVGRATSGLPVKYTILTGPAFLDGELVTLSGDTGRVVIRGEQAGNATYAASPTIDREFNVVGTATSRNQLLAVDKLLVYPNPTSSMLNIRFDLKPGKEVQLSAYNAMGQMVRSWDNARPGQNEFQWPVAGWSKGIYYLIIRNEEGSMMYPFEVN